MAIVISPSTIGFRQLADSQIHKELAGFRPQVRLGTDTSDVTRAMTALQARIKALSGKLTDLRVGANTAQAEAKIAALQAKLLALTKQISSITMKADTTKLDASIKAEQAKLAALQQRMGKLQMDADATRALSKIADLEAEAFHLDKALATMTVDVNIAKAEARLRAIDAELLVLNSSAKTIQLRADNKAIQAAITAVQAHITVLQQQAADIRVGANVDIGKLLATEAGLLGIESAMEKLAPAVNTGDIALGVLGKALTGTGTGWGFLTRGVVLFGGAFNRVLPKVVASVAVWHILADAIIELGAVWIPAGLAVAAFAIAASDAAVEIQRRMQAVHTVMDATGKSVPPMTNAMENLHKAVRPEVYQLFGDALTVMNSRAGTFALVAKATGTVLDQLGARIVYAVTSSNKLGASTQKLSGFWQTAVSDVAKLGDSIGNVFGIFGNFFRAIPGFAAGLLTIGDDFTKVLETASGALVPVLKWILLLHGYILYTGLAVTATLAFVGGIANLAKQFFTFAASSVLAGIGALKSFGSLLVSIGLSIAAYVESIIVAEGATATFGAALAPLAAINPLVWVGAAVVALGALAYWLISSKDAAQQFNDSMQQTIRDAQLSNVVTTIQAAQAATTAKLAEATSKLNATLKTSTVVAGGRAGSFNDNAVATFQATASTDEYRAALSNLDSQSKLVVGRFSSLAKTYGSNTAALGVLNAAGITTAQITDTNAQHWATALIQVSSTTQAYAAMGTQAGVLGNDLDVLGRTVTDQYQAVQKLNQGWSSFISDVTGTQTTFLTFAGGLNTLSQANSTAGISLKTAQANVATAQNRVNTLQASGTTTSLALTAAQDRLSAAQSRLTQIQQNGTPTMSGLNQASIQLQQAFEGQVTAADALFASWRTAGLAGNLFTQGVADAIIPLEQYAKGNQEATAQIAALAQEAGYQGPISLQAINKYLGITTKQLGDTAGATKDLRDKANQATAQEALLTGAMQAQGAFIANQLLGDINQAALKYYGVSAAVTAYGTAVAQSGKDSGPAQAKMTAAILAIVQAEQKMGDNTTQMAAVVSKTFGISMPAAMKLVLAAMDSTVSGVSSAQGAFEKFAIDGLHFTADRAAELWAEFQKNNFGALIAKTDASRSAFDKLASKGLGITTDQADLLWKTLRKQYLDTLAAKGAITRDAFIKLATQGLDLTKTKAQDLWDTLHRQQLTDVATKAGETKTQFEQLAAQLGVTKGYADRLWTSLHNVSGGSPYFVVIKETGTGLFTITGPGIAASQGKGGSGNAAGGLAYGGLIRMGSGPTADDVLAMLSRGEVVVPANMVAAGAVDHLRGRLPGFASGGAVGGGLDALAGQTTGFHSQFMTDMTNSMESAMTSAMKAAEAAAKAAQAAASSSLGFALLPGGGAAAGSSAAAAQAWAHGQLASGVYGWGLSNWPSLLNLWNGESGWRWNAQNPTSPAYGIPQADPGSKMAAAGADWVTNPVTQMRWGLAYIRSVYGSPSTAWSDWLGRSPHWYKAGGLVGMAAGGSLGAKLATAQAGEQAKYYGLEHAFATGLPKFRTKSTMSELHTLTKRQIPEVAAYGALFKGGATQTELSRLGTTARAVAKTASDKALNRAPGGHPGFATELRKYADQLSALSVSRIPAGGLGPGTLPAAPGAPTGKIPQQGAAYLKAWQTRRGGGFGAALGPVVVNQQIAAMQAAQHNARTLATAPGLTRAQHTHYAALAATDAKKLAVLNRELSVERTWRNQLGANDSSLTADIRAAGNSASLAKAVRGWKTQVTRQTATINAISKMLGYSDAYLKAHPPAKLPAGPPPPLPDTTTHTYGGDVTNSIGAFLQSVIAPFAKGGHIGGKVRSYDSGGMLPPGLSTSWNGTGRPEPVGAQPVHVHFGISSSGNNEFDTFMLRWIRRNVHVKGSGNVQRAFGEHWRGN